MPNDKNPSKPPPVPTKGTPLKPPNDPRAVPGKGKGPAPDGNDKPPQIYLMAGVVWASLGRWVSGARGTA